MNCCFKKICGLSLVWIPLIIVKYTPYYKKQKSLHLCTSLPQLIPFVSTPVNCKILELRFYFYWKHFIPPIPSSHWTFMRIF